MSKIDHKIDAHDRTLSWVLEKKKYIVDYFQREYSWEQKHIEQLISDLTISFLNEYTDGDSREDGANYNNYYMGPFVISEKNGTRSIIDGQQRLTSLTLLLIYINNLQKELGLNEDIKDMIFSELRGAKSFNIQVEERTACLQNLFDKGEYTPNDDDDESTINMTNRYINIEECFPDEIKGKLLSFFIDWLKENVILVEIVAYSDENAYTIFETMNDRGLNLTPTEMLKGFLLSRFYDIKTRVKANNMWKESMQTLHDYDKDEDQRFIQSWLRAKYADTIRQGKQGSQNEDFEKIGTRFHNWVRENLSKVALNENDSETFTRFINQDFKFYLKAYLMIMVASNELQSDLEHIYYIDDWGIATSLSYPLLLAPLNPDDSDVTIKSKMNLVAKYIEAFVVRRSINYKKFASSSIRYTMYTLVKEIRGKTTEEIREILTAKLQSMPEVWDNMNKFGMHGQNKKFIKFLLSRISSYVDKQAGINTNYNSYFRPEGKQFEIEHIWANKYERHKNEFDQKTDFEVFRNRMGDLVLLPRGTNQSYGNKEYKDKHKHYVKENLLVQSLTPLAYENNPNFLNMIKSTKLPFKAHEEFKKSDIEDRQALYLSICKYIWGNL
ncbi:MAG: DUF262 domain-containing protein [Campylobacterales bacterium]|nr:DUF262 domain-containing protein [Campylobacterales bacterium]MBN2831845.1 DUF262 domain-containing protein [Campylobacterales bacterium]